MRNMLKEYVEYVDKMIDNGSKKELEALKANHLQKISFFQHERLIHLLVTLAYAIFLTIFIGLSYLNPLFILIVLILLIFLIFYVRHYFFLENNVQYLYKQYDKIIEKINK